MTDKSAEEDKDKTTVSTDSPPDEDSPPHDPVIDYRVGKVETEVSELKQIVVDLTHEMRNEFKEIKETQATTVSTQKKTGMSQGIITFLTGITIWVLQKIYNIVTGNVHN